jgi:hypothetical protein
MGKISLEVRDHLALLTIDAPEARNGLTPPWDVRWPPCATRSTTTRSWR